MKLVTINGGKSLLDRLTKLGVLPYCEKVMKPGSRSRSKVDIPIVREDLSDKQTLDKCEEGLSILVTTLLT